MGKKIGPSQFLQTLLTVGGMPFVGWVGGAGGHVTSKEEEEIRFGSEGNFEEKVREF